VGVRDSATTSLGDQTLHAMRAVAEMTGGREIHVVGDPFAQLTDLPEQNLAAYDLGATLPQGCKGEWCEMKISVKRPGAKVFAPTGFFRSASVKPEEVFAAAAVTPLDFAGLPFVIHFTETQAAGANKKVSFVVTFPPEAEVPPNGSNQLNLEIVAQAMPRGGTIMKTQNYNAAGALPTASVEQIRQFGFTLNNSIELAPGEYTVKFLVRDKATNRVGSVLVPLKVS